MERKSLLTNSQTGIYLSCQTPTLAYNLPLLVKLDNKLTKDKLIKAFKALFKAHPVFNARLLKEKGEVYLTYKEDDPKFEEVKVNKLDKTSLVTPFEMINAPLYRIKFIKAKEGEYLFFDIHHIIFDGFSIKKVFNELVSIIEGNKANLEEYTLWEVANEESALKEKEEFNKAKEYYKNKYDGVDVDSNLITDKKEEKSEYGKLQYHFDLFADKNVKKLTSKYDTNRTSIFQFLFAYTLGIFTGDEEVYYTTVNNGRNEKSLNSYGMFVKTLPIYLNFSKYTEIKEVVKELHDQYEEDINNSLYGFVDISSDLGLNSDILFSYQGEYYYDFIYEGKEYPVEFIETKSLKGNFTIELFKKEDKYFANIEFRKDLYDEDTINHFMSLYEHYLLEIINKDKLDDIIKTNDKELEIVDSFNDKHLKGYDFNISMLDMFAKAVKDNPNKKCIVVGERSYSYKEVDDLSNRLAGYIISKGYKKDDVASILIHRNEFILIAPLGVLKAGLVYQPLDSSYPKERLNFMIKDSGATLLITEPDLIDVVDEYKGEHLFTEKIKDLEAFSSKLPTISPNDRFTLLYTSGSTGVPKGVQLMHGNLSVFLQYVNKNFEKVEAWSAYASFGFDANMYDMYGAVTSGATLHVIDEDMRLDLKKMNEYFEANNIGHSFMTTQVGRQFSIDYQNKSLKRLVTGGEKLVPLDPPKNFNIYNAYGPTECTVYVTDFLVDKYYHRIPIGKGIEICHLYVLDKKGNRLPYGVPGELYISGPQVAKGYLNREEQNKIAFLDNPFDKSEHFDRIYKTGDIVRFLKDGTVDFIGRKDSQVKIRGFRIELSEVESIIRKYPGIKDATVNSYNAKVGGMFIAAFITSDSKVDIDDLKKFIGDNKPSYMIPEVIMQLDKIPLNQNGKVNKRALPTPEKKAENIVAPRDKIEKKLYEILKDILGTEEFGVTNDIYYLGLTSIASIKFITLISETLNKDLDIKDLHEAKTIENIAKSLKNDVKTEDFEILDKYPITKTQEGIFVESTSHKDSTIYNIPVVYSFSKKVDIVKLTSAIVKSVNNHPYLKGTLSMDDNGDIFINRNDNEEVIIEVVDSKTEEPKFNVKPFNLLGDRLYRIKIYKGPKQNYLFIDTHHIVSDGTSLAVLFDDINKAYEGLELEKEKLDGFNYALWEKKESTEEEIAKQKKYYSDLLSGIDVNSTPRKEYNLPTEGKMMTNDYYLDLDLTKLDTFNKKHHLSNNIFFNAVFSYTLSKFNGLEESLYTTIYNGRGSLKLSRSVVMLVKTLPVYLKFNKEEKVLDYLNDCKNQITTSQENTLYSYSDLVSEHKLNIDVMFAYQGDGMLSHTLAGEQSEVKLIDSEDAKSIFSVDASEENGKIKLHYEYMSNYYLEDTTKYFYRLFNLIASEFLNKEYLKDINMVDLETMREMDNYNEVEDTPIAKSYVELFVKEALAHPDKLAVAAIDEDITYGELHRRSNLVANEIIKNGLVKDDKVALILPRIANAYAATQGVLKSGAAYLPIDPNYPDDRVSYILEDSNAKLVITTKNIYEQKQSIFKAKTLLIEDILQNSDDKYHPVDIDPKSLAYCIYTSGSTGKPKGVMIEHHSLCNYVSYTEHNLVSREYKELGSVTVSLASLSFDLSVQEQMVPLANGMSVVLASEDEILNPLILTKRLDKYKVDFITTTPSYVNNVLDIEEVVESFKRIRCLDIGAEALPVSLLRKMKEKGLTWAIHNGYGPTEATVACTMDYVSMDDTRITIGYPLANYKAFIIDTNNQRLPFGAVGELLIAGEGVARGYINRDDLTKEKFITFNGLPSYKTGDLARLNYDGRVEFFGRKDNQVKLRGLRVELDEIENQINKYKGINNSVVVVKENSTDGQFLVAYFTSKNDIDIEDLKKEIGKSLTPYMIPKVFMRLNEMPLTNNGKVDKKALPEPEVKSSESKGRKPTTKNQELLFKIFSKVLGMSNFSIDDDFFSLGGTSLSASKLTMLAMKEGLNVSYSDVFDYPTVAELDAFLRANGVKEEKIENKEEEVSVREALAHNVIPEVDKIKSNFKYSSVLLLGSTGFLGIHLLKQLIDEEGIKIITLVRKGDAPSVEDRLKGMLAYYFEDPFEEAFVDRIKAIEGDVTDDNLIEKLKDVKFDLIINCAAIVKHFAKDDSIERVNYGGVKNLIEVAKHYKVRLIQTSTLSVAGENVNGKFPPEKRIHESECFFGQDISNKYVNSKIKAEEAILEAVEKDGLDGKIVRVGNLMGRQVDGEFQINALTNNFMNSLKAYEAMGMFPIDMADETIDFSPIDEVAKTILLFACTPKEFTVFHAANSHEVEMGNVIHAMNEYGFKIDMVSNEEFNGRLTEFISDETKSAQVASLLSYRSSDEQRLSTYILSDNKFSIKALYRLGYKWPITEEKYIYRMIEALATLGYFDL